MAKNLVTLLEEALELAKAGEEATTAVVLPEPSEIETIEKEEMLALAESLKLDTEGRKPSAIRAALLVASTIVHTDDVPEKAELASLCEIVGIAPAKKSADTIASLKEYFESGTDTADGEAAEEVDEDEKPAKAKKVKAAAAEDEDEDEDEKPAKKKKSADEDEDEDEDEKPAKKKKVVAADDEDEDAKPAKKKKPAADEDEDEGDDEPPKAAKYIAAYNEVADEDSQVESWKQLKKKLTDNDGNVAKWGKAYAKGDEAYCCGLPLKTVKKGKTEYGQCAVTDTLWTQDEDGNLVAAE